MSAIHLDDVWKEYGDHIVLERITLDVELRAFIALVGPSGCGKTTFLRMLLGEEAPTRGRILVDGVPLRPEPDADRGVVFQRYSVFPHLTVLQNVLLGRELQHAKMIGRLFGATKRAATDDAMALLAEVGLVGHENKYPAALSGGMQQRLALAQAIMRGPKILLLDEPFGALDPGIRADIHVLMKRLWNETELTVVMVTHDLSEAFRLATRVIAFERNRNRPEECERYGATISRDLEIYPRRAADVRCIRSFAPVGTALPKKEHSRDDLARVSEKGQIMILTEEQKAEIAANRKRYEELKAAGQGQAPRALPPPTPRVGAPIEKIAVVHREVIPGGWYWTTRLRRGEALRLINVSGASCVSILAWSSVDPSERLNHADTIKVQWAASLRKGRVILSDMGRVLFGIIEETSGGAHDPITGCSTAATNVARYGVGQLRNTRDNFILAAGKLGLDRRDVHPCINFFAPVSVNADGHFQWDAGRRSPGDFIDLRAEMDLLVALSNCPHPLDPSPIYAQNDVEIVRYQAALPDDNDLCRTASAEAARAFENNAFSLNSGIAGGEQ